MNDIFFKLKAAKIDKSGRAPVFLEFNFEAQTLVYSTGEKCFPSEWDDERQKFRRSMQGYQEANEYLEVLREKLRRVYRESRTAGVQISSGHLRDCLKSKPVEISKTDLLPLFEKFVKLRVENEGLEVGTAKNMHTTATRIKKFLETGVRLRMDSYTGEVHQGFMNHLYQIQDLEPSSAANTCKHLITFFKWISKHHQLHPNHAQIKTYAFESDRIYLTEWDLEKLDRVALHPNLGRVRDAFLFQCYTGLRFGDLWRLENRHIEQRDGYSVICLIPEKSVRRAGRMRRIEIPLLPGALEILDRYAGEFRLLPVLSNQKYNSLIKEAAQMAGLDELVEVVEYENPKLSQVEKWKRVSTHVARHTFATLSLIKGVPLEVVSKSLGHTRLATTMVYAKVADEWKNQIILKPWQKAEPTKSNPDPDA